MDLILRITFASGDAPFDMALARMWMAEQIRFFTGLTIAGFEDAIHPATTFKIAALEYLDAT